MLSQLYEQAVKNWRSTLNGLISAAIAVIVAVCALPPGLRKIAYVLAGLRALVGFLQKDCNASCANATA